MHTAQDGKAASILAFRYGRRSIRVLGDDVAPTGELRAVLPVNVVLRPTGELNVDRLLIYSLIVRAEELVDHPRHLQAVVGGFTSEESSRAQPEVVHAIADRLPHIRGSSFGEVLANGD